MPYQYNVNPTPRTGQGAFGLVPGRLNLPSPSQDLSAQYPNLAPTNAALSADILAGLGGELSPGTVNMLQDQNAAWAIGAGMPATRPGSLSTNRFARNLGLTAEQLKNTAIGQYQSIIPTVAGTQTVAPGLQTEIASQNALNAAAPDPAAAQSYARNLFDRYMQTMAGAGGNRRMAPIYTPPTSTGTPFGAVAAADNQGMYVARGPQGGDETPAYQPRYGASPGGGGGYFYAGQQGGVEDVASQLGIDPAYLQGYDLGDYAYAEGTPGGGYDVGQLAWDLGL